MEYLDELNGKTVKEIRPSPGREEDSLDIIFEDGTILCIDNSCYICEE